VKFGTKIRRNSSDIASMLVSQQALVKTQLRFGTCSLYPTNLPHTDSDTKQRLQYNTINKMTIMIGNISEGLETDISCYKPTTVLPYEKGLG